MTFKNVLSLFCSLSHALSLSPLSPSPTDRVMCLSTFSHLVLVNKSHLPLSALPHPSDSDTLVLASRVRQTASKGLYAMVGDVTLTGETVG
jgi:hypothetical protein